MASHSAADASDRSDGGGAALDPGRPISLWIVTGIFALSGATYLLGDGAVGYAVSGSAATLTGGTMLVIAGGLWYGQKWAFVTAMVLQAIGLLLALITIDYLAVVIGISLLGATAAIPRRVWN